MGVPKKTKIVEDTYTGRFSVAFGVLREVLIFF